MELLTHETEYEIFQYLREIGCCICCSLRFVGTRSLESFVEPVSSAKKLKYVKEDDNSFTEDGNPCVACLGVLQDVTQKNTMENIINAVNKAGHDDVTFNSALTLPICLSLRERSVQEAVVEKFNLSDSQQIGIKLKTQSIKEIWKSKMLGHVEVAIKKKVLSAPIPSPLLIEIYLSHDNDETELASFSRCNGKKKQKFSRKTMDTVLTSMTSEKFREFYNVPPSKSEKFVNVEPVACTRSSTFLGGRYAKYSRELSQTPWFINGEKKMETSVQDLICAPMIELTRADAVKFLSSGREDVDVRNIHSGRPFAVELVNPRVTIIPDEKLDEVVRKINESTTMVTITTKLKFLDTSDLRRLKEGENEKTKVYRALCTLKNTSKKSIHLEKLNTMKDVEIVQKTPMRVLHRRPLVPRVRLIHGMRARWLRPEEEMNLRERLAKSEIEDSRHIENLFVLDVKTQAGTYVKEFIHGDFLRTRPNLSDLLDGDFDICALDVTQINLDWP